MSVRSLGFSPGALPSHRPECLLGRSDRALNIFLAVSSSEKRRLILRKWKIHPAVQHSAEKLPKRFRILFRSRIPICDRPLLEEPCEHRSNAVVAQRNASLFCRRRKAVGQLAAQLLQSRINLSLAISKLLEYRASSSHRQRIPRQR